MKNKLIGRAVRLSEYAKLNIDNSELMGVSNKLPSLVYESPFKHEADGTFYLSFSEQDCEYEETFHIIMVDIEPIEEKEVDSDNSINHFVEFLKDNYSIEIPDMAVQEYLKHENK